MKEEERISNLESQLATLIQRNKRVEGDKAWETSGTRLVVVITITYLVACSVLWTIGAERFWLGALVPVVGFYLSTQTLPPLKRRWLQRRESKVNEDSCDPSVK